MIANTVLIQNGADPAQCDAGGHDPQHESPVTFAHGPVIAPRSPDHRPQHAAVLAEQGEQGHQQHQPQADAGQQGEGQDQGAVGGDVAQLVEIGPQARLLVEFPSQHAVDGVERHAHQHPDRYQHEHPGVMHETRDHYAHQD